MLVSAPVALALDNAETPWEADTHRIEELLAQFAAAPGLAIDRLVAWGLAFQPGAIEPGDRARAPAAGGGAQSVSGHRRGVHFRP